MSFLITKFARRTFAGQIKGLEPEDPHYETYVDSYGATKTRKRKLPPGLSKRDEKVLLSVRRRAHYLDKGFNIFGFKFGWSAILGLIPIAGDLMSFILSYLLIFRKCQEAKLPMMIYNRMLFNHAVSLGFGLVPIVGDIILAVWKGNSRNALLLEEFLIHRAKNAGKIQAPFPGTSSPDETESAKLALQSLKLDPFSANRVGSSTLEDDLDEPSETSGLLPGSYARSDAVPGSASASTPTAKSTGVNTGKREL